MAALVEALRARQIRRVVGVAGAAWEYASSYARERLQGVDLSQLPKIQETYAGTLRDNARAGEWIQMPDGKWRKK